MSEPAAPAVAIFRQQESAPTIEDFPDAAPPVLGAHWIPEIPAAAHKIHVRVSFEDDLGIPPCMIICTCAMLVGNIKRMLCKQWSLDEKKVFLRTFDGHYMNEDITLLAHGVESPTLMKSVFSQEVRISTGQPTCR
jgi:hypothetical protein